MFFFYWLFILLPVLMLVAFINYNWYPAADVCWSSTMLMFGTLVLYNLKNIRKLSDVDLYIVIPISIVWTLLVLPLNFMWELLSMPVSILSAIFYVKSLELIRKCESETHYGIVASLILIYEMIPGAILGPFDNLLGLVCLIAVFGLQKIFKQSNS